jgi:hypothetical protein
LIGRNWDRIGRSSGCRPISQPAEARNIDFAVIQVIENQGAKRGQRHVLRRYRTDALPGVADAVTLL